MFIEILAEGESSRKFLPFTFESDALDLLVEELGEATRCIDLYMSLFALRESLRAKDFPLDIVFVFETEEELQDLKYVMANACVLYEFYVAVKKLLEG